MNKQFPMDKTQLMELWRTIFQDSEDFVQLYFDRVYRPQRTVAIEENGRIMSALHMLPYEMTYTGEVVQASYISGACTLPERRGMGLMKDVLARSFRRMLQQKMALSFLIPAEKWLFGYYRKMGYFATFTYGIKRFVPSKEPVVSGSLRCIDASQLPPKDVFSFWNRQLRQYPSCILHTFYDFETICTDWSQGGGFVVAAMGDRGGIRALAFVVESQSEPVFVREIVYRSIEDKNFLLHTLARRSCAPFVVYRTCAPPKESVDYGMARIICAQTMLRLYAAAHPDVIRSFFLADEWLPENNGYYILSCGTCRKEDCTEGPGERMDMETLTGWLLPRGSSWMNMMLD